MEDIGRDVCVRCKLEIEGQPILGSLFGKPVIRCQTCAKDISQKTNKKRGEDPGPIAVADGHSECTAKYHSRCMVCKGRVHRGNRMVWRRGTRVTYHPRCWRMKGQFLLK